MTTFLYTARTCTYLFRTCREAQVMALMLEAFEDTEFDAVLLEVLQRRWSCYDGEKSSVMDVRAPPACLLNLFLWCVKELALSMTLAALNDGCCRLGGPRAKESETFSQRMSSSLTLPSSHLFAQWHRLIYNTCARARLFKCAN